MMILICKDNFEYCLFKIIMWHFYVNCPPCIIHSNRTVHLLYTHKLTSFSYVRREGKGRGETEPVFYTEVFVCECCVNLALYRAEKKGHVYVYVKCMSV